MRGLESIDEMIIDHTRQVEVVEVICRGRRVYLSSSISEAKSLGREHYLPGRRRILVHS